MSIWRYIFFGCLLCFQAAQARPIDGLVLSVPPYLPASELEARFSPLTQYLTAALGREVKLRIAQTNQQQIALLGRGVIDLAYIGPASYLELVYLQGIHPLLGRLEVNGSPLFSGTIFVRTDSQIQALEELRDQRFAFGDTHTAMGYLVPRQLLARAGVSLNDLAGYQLLGGQPNAALAVLSGHYAAGAAKTEVFSDYKARGLRAIATTPPVSEYLFVARNRLDPALLEHLRTLFLALRDSEAGRAALQAIRPGVTGIVPAADSDYDSLRSLLGRELYRNDREIRDE